MKYAKWCTYIVVFYAQPQPVPRSNQFEMSPYKKRTSTVICKTKVGLTRRQHPLTGQHAANFRLLANQWAERRLLTQWTSWLPRYDAKCVQRSWFQCWSVPLRSDIKGTELPPANILIPLERQLIALQLCCWQFLNNETLQQTFCPLLSKLSKRRHI